MPPMRQRGAQSASATGRGNARRDIGALSGSESEDDDSTAASAGVFWH